MAPVLNANTCKSFLSRLAIVMLLSAFSTAGNAGVFDEGDYDNGKALFKANCASCHKPTNEVLAAPGLQGIAQRWKAPEELLITWVQNPQEAIATGDPYITGLIKQWESSFGIMNAQLVSEADIKDIMNYVVNYVPEDGTLSPTDDCPTIHDVQEEEGDNTVIWFLVLGVFFLIVAFAAGGINRSLQGAIAEREGKMAPAADVTYLQATKQWMSGNRAFVSLAGFFVTAVLVTAGYNVLMDVGVYEGYEPEQPIWFSHSVHACQNEIDCEYCHHTARESKHASIPSANICMNCHKGINKGAISGTEEIAKIYAAIGFDAEKKQYIEDYEEQPIKWNKVHVLPDHVYFSHAQHVTVAGLDCRNCHGPVETYTVGRQATVAEINAQEIPGLIELSKPTLTMGWCIECHNKAEIDLTSSDYYVEMHERLKGTARGNEELARIKEDEKVTVKELGGWECAKCHY